MRTPHFLTTAIIVSATIFGSSFSRADEPAARSDAASQSLFNGKDLTGWHADVPELDKNPAAKSPFVVRDGKLVSLGTPGGHLDHRRRA